MYIYKDMCIDNFNGMYRLNTFIQECIHASKEISPSNHLFSSFYMKEPDLKSFLIHSFVSIKLISDWEGDLRGNDCIAISALPYTGILPHLLIALKQDNNGSSYIASEVQLDYLTKEHNVHAVNTKNMSFKIDDLLKANKMATKLYEKIIDDVYLESKDAINQNKEFLLEVIGSDKIKKELNNNMNDFEKIG